MPPRSKNINWFETWNRRSRLRSGTLMLRSLNIPSEEPPGFSKKPKDDHNAEDCLKIEIVEDDVMDNDVESCNIENVGQGLGENDMDAEYKVFLDHLRVDGRSYVFEMVVDGSPVILKYEEEGDTGEVIQTQPNKRSRDVTPSPDRPQSGKKKSKRGSSSPNSSEIVDAPTPPISQNDVEECSLVDESYQIFLNHVRTHNGSMILEMDNNVVVRYEEQVGEEEAQIEEVIFKYEEMKDKPGEAMKEVVVKCEQIEDKVIDKYVQKKDKPEEVAKEVVVKCEQIEDDFVEDVVEVLPTETEILTKEEGVYSCTLLLQPYAGFSTPSCLACEDDHSMESLTFKISAPYKDRLAAVLQKPFDQNEYDELLKVATNHGRKTKYKHLRHDSKAYPTNEPGRSYLDYYPDLAKQIEVADCPMGLILLRGFFFWLKNVGHEGAFKPWVPTSSCYEVVPIDTLDSVVPLQIKMP